MDGTRYAAPVRETQRRLEPVVILRNGHMTIAHCAIYLLCNYLVPIAQGMQSVMYIHCCNRAELARCVETTVCHNCAQQTGTIDTCQGANAHWAMPHLSGRRSSLLKRVRFGYGSLTNLFSTTLSIQANSRVLTLTVSAKRKPVHSSYRDVTTKSERVIAHVIGSNLLCAKRIVQWA